MCATPPQGHGPACGPCVLDLFHDPSKLLVELTATCASKHRGTQEIVLFLYHHICVFCGALIYDKYDVLYVMHLFYITYSVPCN